MKLPKRIADILKRKQEFIDLQRTKLENTIVRLQSRLLSDVIAEMIPELDIVDGIIQDNAKNYKIISYLDKIYKDFNQGAILNVGGQIINTTGRIASLSENYFSIVLAGNLPKRFEKIIEKTNKLVNLRIGLDGGKFVRGGFLESFFNSNTIGLELKEITSKAVTSGMRMRDLVRLLREKIGGINDRAGMMERQYQRYVYDLYQQYDAAYNMMLGNEFGFTYFIYQGGLVKDSRDFCVSHNNKVWSKDESEGWATWTPAQGEYPDGYEVKAKDIYAVPSYLGYPGYDPLIDRGGYNCGHSLGWIPDDMAFDMRPDLRN